MIPKATNSDHKGHKSAIFDFLNNGVNVRIKSYQIWDKSCKEYDNYRKNEGGDLVRGFLVH